MKLLPTALIPFAAILAVPAAMAEAPETADLPEAPGKAQVLQSCTQCHGVAPIAAQRRSPDEWSEVVSRMIGSGAALTDEQYEAVVSYLSKNMSATGG